MLVLVLATLAAAGYLYLGRGSSSGSATGFLGANQQSVKATGTVITAADRVQRFVELHAFDAVAFAQQRVLTQQLATLQSIEAGVSGRQKQIAGETVTTVKQAIDAVGQYREAVAVTYRLADANTAHQDLSNAFVSLQQQAQAWQHS